MYFVITIKKISIVAFESQTICKTYFIIEFMLTTIINNDKKGKKRNMMKLNTNFEKIVSMFKKYRKISKISSLSKKTRKKRIEKSDKFHKQHNHKFD